MGSLDELSEVAISDNFIDPNLVESMNSSNNGVKDRKSSKKKRRNIVDSSTESCDVEVESLKIESLLNPNSLRRDLRSSIASIGKSKATEQITYTWENIDVWTPGSVKDDEDAENEAKEDKNFTNKLSKLLHMTKKPKKAKQILKNVSGIVRPGELVAIMGASGAGKTTLLNLLTFRNTGKLKVSGTRCVNGVPIGPNSLTSVSSFVQQDDMFIGSLTVREHLIFQALVRMHKHIPYERRMERVEEVIQEFGLSKCASTQIGSPGRFKGISGGEMKRLSFASEVLTDPPLMFCDEPTSGLDSAMAQNIVSVLKGLAAKGKTIVSTIHQPSSEVYAQFDKILLMAEGRVAFMGHTKDVLSFFSENGFICPTNYNPADFYIQTLAIQPGDEEVCQARAREICNAFEASEHGQEIKRTLELVSVDPQSAEYFEAESKVIGRSPYKASWMAQFRATLWRSWLSYVKDPLVLKVQLFQTIAVALVLGLIYYGQKFNQDGIQNITGVLFLLITHFTVTHIFGVLDSFCVECPIFLREHFNGMYRTDVYFLSKLIAELPFYLVLPGVFTSICYPMIGLNPNMTSFLETVGILTLIANCSCSFGYLLSCFTKSITVALALAPPFMLPLILVGGFFLNSGSIPIYFSWMRYISWFYYGNEALAVSQWRTIDHIECNREISTCPQNGEVILTVLDFYEENFVTDICAIAALVVGFRILAYFALLSKTYRQK